jgi:hypothetical protein
MSAQVFGRAPTDCKNGGWRNFSQFKNQGDCVSFVEMVSEWRLLRRVVDVPFVGAVCRRQPLPCEGCMLPCWRWRWS